MSDWYVLDGHTPRKVDLMTGGRQFDDVNSRRVGKDAVGDLDVSTVFLGLDHNWGSGPPILFETMVFGGDLDEPCWRYATWDEAAAGHAEVVAALREGREPNPVAR